MPSDSAIDLGPCRYRLTPNRRDLASERRRLERDLAVAAQEGRFLLHYQPRVALATGQPCAAEALLRWPHRQRGMISPAVFVPLAEQSGQIVPISGWVLRAACQEARNWRAPWIVSVNVSARQLAAGVLLAQVAAALEESGLPPERLELELTESQLISIDTETLLTLSAVRDAGVGLALDDFGTGYASLALLKRLPLTVMKLDRSLVRNLPTDRDDAAIVRAVVATGHALGLRVVAEGVETEAQRAFLTACRCDEGQGYLFSQPVPPERLAARKARYCQPYRSSSHGSALL
jgi:EAL domain-containing protein (putative c-di-GMP-specific phosphodiesterase class I)